MLRRGGGGGRRGDFVGLALSLLWVRIPDLGSGAPRFGTFVGLWVAFLLFLSRGAETFTQWPSLNRRGMTFFLSAFFTFFSSKTEAREGRWGTESLSLWGHGPCPPRRAPPPEEQNADLTSQASMTFHWGPGSACWRVTSVWLCHGVVRAAGRRAEGNPPLWGPRANPRRTGLG